MSLMIDMPGTYRGKIADAGVSKSSGGFPQFTARFVALEMFNEETDQWEAWDYGQDMVGWFVLYTKNKQDGQWKELLNCQQIKKALGWDGASFADLANGDYSTTLVMFRIEESEYNGNTSLKITWIDAGDASPTRQLQKYDSTKLKEMDQEFAGVLASKTPKPASAKHASAATPPKRGRPAGSKNAASAPETGAPTASGSPVAPPASPSKPPTTPPPVAAGGCTKDEAWASCSEKALQVPMLTDEKLAEAWLAEAEKIGKAEDTFTPADWATVRDGVIAATAKF